MRHLECALEAQPEIRVGIMKSREIHPIFHGSFLHEPSDGYSEIISRHIPQEKDALFSLQDVSIGIDFHWQKRESQTFRGILELHREADEIRALNILPLEDYLESVVSSEMSASAPLEFLKAHAVISRSWALRKILARLDPQEEKSCVAKCEREDEVIRWYDGDGHEGFDVCADDHCQRYQGVGRLTSEAASEAVRATRGEVILSDEEQWGIVDARFSKCCGGAMETFDTCWDDTPHSCLRPGRDSLSALLPDLRDEATARKWIMDSPEAFCRDADEALLKEVLNDYDLPTRDFYRWKVEYSTGELEDILRRKSGFDFGELLELTPLQRGRSGRISRLRIVGSRLTMTVGKELEIRRWLSETHLYSSAFVAERRRAGGWGLHGAGWGHGVGLCQIGAAVMASRGIDHRRILAHYYPGSRLATLWE